MSRSPNRFRPNDALSVAEAVFKPAPPAVEPVVVEKQAGVPISKEQVSLRLDGDLIAHFQEDGPGWQDRINDALRRAAGLWASSMEAREAVIVSITQVRCLTSTPCVHALGHG